MSALRRLCARAPWGLAGMVALVVTVEFLIARHEADLILPIAWEWRYSARATANQARDCEILSFGDSLSKLGILPNVVERQTGRRTFNLAVAGGQAPSSFFLLRRALEAGAHPRAVLIDCEFNLMAKSLDYNLRQWPELVDLRDAFDLAWTARDPSFFATVAVGLVLRSFKDRHDIRASLMRALRGDYVDLRSEARTYRRNWDVNRGAQILATNPNCEDFVVPAGVPLVRADWRPTLTNTEHLRRFLNLAASRKITVFWLLTPIAPGLQDVFDRRGDAAQLERFIRQAQARWPNLVVLDARHSGYQRTAFVDAVHLGSSGSLVFSHDVAAVVDRYLSAANAAPGSGSERAELSRWVALPQFGERPMGPAVEDLDHSRVAVHLARGARR